MLALWVGIVLCIRLHRRLQLNLVPDILNQLHPQDRRELGLDAPVTYKQVDRRWNQLANAQDSMPQADRRRICDEVPEAERIHRVATFNRLVATMIRGSVDHSRLSGNIAIDTTLVPAYARPPAAGTKKLRDRDKPEPIDSYELPDDDLPPGTPAPDSGSTNPCAPRCSAASTRDAPCSGRTPEPHGGGRRASSCSAGGFTSPCPSPPTTAPKNPSGSSPRSRPNRPPLPRSRSHTDRTSRRGQAQRPHRHPQPDRQLPRRRRRRRRIQRQPGLELHARRPHPWGPRVPPAPPTRRRQDRRHRRL